MGLLKGLMLTALVVAMAGCETVQTIQNDVKQDFKQTFGKNAINSKRGLYQDATTGLMWYVCPVGSKWGDIDAYGDKADYYACSDKGVLRLNAKDTEAYLAKFINGQNFAGYSDWRLPTVFELEQLRANNCVEWEQERTGTVLTANGREDTYQTAVRETLDNNGMSIGINDCSAATYDKLTKNLSSPLVKIRGGGRPYEFYNYGGLLRVSLSATKPKSYVAAYAKGSSDHAILDYEFIDERLDDDKVTPFFIVRQATAPKSAQGANP
ncbi:Lcl domain-containing protein [Moraxella marmotae]|uniref:Lcl domain-containing protein n=1 Tax=Moraxella marmotae TaxID=3344520 RepID=UPI0035F2E272